MVAEHFANRENQLKWHPDLKSIKILEGRAGEQGCKSLLKFTSFEIVETVLHNRLPDDFLGDYDTPGVCHNTMQCQFIARENQTKMVVTVDYFKMNWFMKTMSVLMPWALKGQVKKFLKKFKQVVEEECANGSA